MANGFNRVDTTANRIKEALSLREMKQADIVLKTGINKGALSSYISGRYEPKQDAIYKMAKALDVSEMWLWGYDISMDRPAEQKANDELVDLINLLKKNKEFRSLVLDLSKLNSKQLEAIKNVIDAILVE